jgi:hypothetical protein
VVLLVDQAGVLKNRNKVIEVTVNVTDGDYTIR